MQITHLGREFIHLVDDSNRRPEKAEAFFCTVNRSPLTLTLNILSKWASVIDPKGANSKTPALAKRYIDSTFLLLHRGVQPIKICEI